MTLARQQGQGNIDTVRRAWGDDRVDVPGCDIAIASRSATVEDLAAAIRHLQRHVRLRVALTYLVGGRFIDGAARSRLCVGCEVDLDRAAEGGCPCAGRSSPGNCPEREGACKRRVRAGPGAR